jgi:hypothetical protein
MSKKFQPKTLNFFKNLCSQTRKSIFRSLPWWSQFIFYRKLLKVFEIGHFKNVHFWKVVWLFIQKNKILHDSTFLFHYRISYKITIFTIIKRSIYTILFVRCSVPSPPGGAKRPIETPWWDPFMRPSQYTHSEYTLNIPSQYII